MSYLESAYRRKTVPQSTPAQQELADQEDQQFEITQGPIGGLDQKLRYLPRKGMSVVNTLFNWRSQLTPVLKRTPMRVVCGVCSERTETVVVKAKQSGVSKLLWKPFPCCNPFAALLLIIAMGFIGEFPQQSWVTVRSWPASMYTKCFVPGWQTQMGNIDTIEGYYKDEGTVTVEGSTITFNNLITKVKADGGGIYKGTIEGNKGIVWINPTQKYPFEYDSKDKIIYFNGRSSGTKWVKEVEVKQTEKSAYKNLGKVLLEKGFIKDSTYCPWLQNEKLSGKEVYGLDQNSSDFDEDGYYAFAFDLTTVEAVRIRTHKEKMYSKVYRDEELRHFVRDPAIQSLQRGDEAEAIRNGGLKIDLLHILDADQLVIGIFGIIMFSVVLVITLFFCWIYKCYCTETNHEHYCNNCGSCIAIAKHFQWSFLDRNYPKLSPKPLRNYPPDFGIIKKHQGCT